MKNFLGIENKFRVDHHGSEHFNIDMALPQSHKILLDQNGYREIYNEDGVTVEAFAVNHEPIVPALGYRIKYQDKILVISGDTKKSANLLKYAKDADILLHEALAFDLLERAINIQEQRGNHRNSTILEDILEYHTSPAQAAEVAANAGVKKLILSHLGPAPENPLSRRFYIAGADEIFQGPILLAEDGDLYTIE